MDKAVSCGMRVLDLGCGKRKRPGAVGVDISEETDADVIHDLNVFPYPFNDNEFDYVYIDNTIEHLDNIVKVMEELHRVTRDGATLEIIVPFFRSVWAFIDPTHRHFFTLRSFDYFDPDKPYNQLYKYSKCHFKVEKTVFDERIPHPRWLGRFVTSFANRRPYFYEWYLASFIPLNTITYYLRTIKS